MRCVPNVRHTAFAILVTPRSDIHATGSKDEGDGGDVEMAVRRHCASQKTQRTMSVRKPAVVEILLVRVPPTRLTQALRDIGNVTVTTEGGKPGAKHCALGTYLRLHSRNSSVM